jgi:hypothetical protein
MCGETGECRQFCGMFSCFNFRMEDSDISIKTRNANTLGDGNPDVLWHSIKTLVNFMLRLTSINLLCLDSLKHEHSSQQYTVKHVCIPISC